MGVSDGGYVDSSRFPSFLSLLLGDLVATNHSQYSEARNIQMTLELLRHRVNNQGLSRSFCKP